MTKTGVGFPHSRAPARPTTSRSFHRSAFVMVFVMVFVFVLGLAGPCSAFVRAPVLGAGSKCSGRSRNRSRSCPHPTIVRWSSGPIGSGVSFPDPPERNAYDAWLSGGPLPESLHLDEETAGEVLLELVGSFYGSSVFGCHERAASIGITGSLSLEEVCGPEVVLGLEGSFWHKRSTVLGRAAVWLNARIPEVASVVVSDLEDLEDFEEIRDEESGEVLFRRDKRSEDFNGDRATMEYQGLDPDDRGPFPQSAMGGGGSMINPA
ncbi:unnamed protein product [Pseudo-nitzschia multistriata]|uniref:Uncharacterized protein n=1 Tax=Pseudo-nitzschia multistriata TaxID=183589 RepID=A0A448ZKT9_9STRA|nr:unnamed protein product [Pseudo-nitzschia multistriata]